MLSEFLVKRTRSRFRRGVAFVFKLDRLLEVCAKAGTKVKRSESLLGVDTITVSNRKDAAVPPIVAVEA